MPSTEKVAQPNNRAEDQVVLRPQLVVEGGLLGLIVGVLVVLPWAFGGGYLLLLDWISGPESTLSPGVFGLSESALDAMPFRIGSHLLRDWLGADVVGWLLIFIFFPIGGAGIAKVASRSRWRAYPAVLLFLCNPFVVDRVRTGHVSVLIGLALLPWIFAAARDAREQDRWFAVRPALWYALAISMNPHSAWLGGVVLLSIAFLPRPSWKDLARTVMVVVSAGLVYSYALVLLLSDAKTIAVSEADLDAYRTHAGPGGLLPTVLSLHGYWRDPDGQVLDVVGPFIGIIALVIILACIVVGLAKLTQTEASKAWPLIGLLVAGLLLGAGVDGPLGPLYRFAFDVLPLFEAMREQQKWLELALLGYAVGFGVTVQWIAREVGRRWRARGSRLVPFALGLVPAVAAPALLWGLGGSVQTSDYPAGWYEAQARMGTGPGKVLFLPWHAYQSFDFTDGRTVATPASAFFSRSVLSSDAVELPNLRTDSTSLRMTYLDRVLAAGGNGGFARLVAPLGIEYVTLARTGEQDDYAWLADEPDLTVVQHSPKMITYRVDVAGTGRVVTGRYADVFEAITLAGEDGLGSEAVLEPDGGRRDVSDQTSRQSGGLQQQSSTLWNLAPGERGWVMLPEEFSTGWQLNGESGQLATSGGIAFWADESAGTIEYEPWRLLGPAVGFSLFALLVLIVLGVREHQAQIRGLLPGGEDRADDEVETPA